MSYIFLLAPDKFKGSLSALEVCQAMERGILSVFPDAEIIHCPIADGGDGFVDVLCEVNGGRWVSCDVEDALGREIEARYVLSGKTAIMEMSSASGIRHISEQDRNVWKSNTFGTGQMMRHAIEHHRVKKIIMGIGGSATNDAGCGMAAALGVRFYDHAGRELTPVPEYLIQCDKIDFSEMIDLPEILVACDVTNPLMGNQGATAIYGPQKGVVESDIPRFEKLMSEIVRMTGGEKLACQAGAGAAGGLGFGLMKFGKAQLMNGFDLIADELNLLEKIKQADVVITGEGKLDQQTLHGKGPAGVAKLVQEHGKRIFAIAGIAEPETLHLFEKVFQLHDGKRALSETIERGAELIREKAKELAKLI